MMWKRMLVSCAVVVATCFPLMIPQAVSAACGVDPPITTEGFSWPATGPVSTAWSLDCRTDRGHRGIDIAVSAGDPIKASTAGVVSFVGFTPAEGGGTTISIEHPSGIRTTYIHLDQVNISKGQTIAQGQQLGTSDGSPLHFGIKLATTRELYFNPLAYLPTPVAPTETSSSDPETEIDPEARAAYPGLPTPESPAAQSSTGSPATAQVNPSAESAFASGSAAQVTATVSGTRAGESNTLTAPMSSQTGNLEKLLPDISSAVVDTAATDGIPIPFSVRTVSSFQKSSSPASSNRQFVSIASGASPLRYLLLTALLLIVTAGSGIRGKVTMRKAGRLKPAAARLSA